MYYIIICKTEEVLIDLCMNYADSGHLNPHSIYQLVNSVGSFTDKRIIVCFMSPLRLWWYKTYHITFS